MYRCTRISVLLALLSALSLSVDASDTIANIYITRFLQCGERGFFLMISASLSSLNLSLNAAHKNNWSKTCISQTCICLFDSALNASSAHNASTDNTSSDGWFCVITCFGCIWAFEAFGLIKTEVKMVALEGELLRIKTDAVAAAFELQVCEELMMIMSEDYLNLDTLRSQDRATGFQGCSQPL